MNFILKYINLTSNFDCNWDFCISWNLFFIFFKEFLFLSKESKNILCDLSLEYLFIKSYFLVLITQKYILISKWM